jgi:hypothetical protein
MRGYGGGTILWRYRSEQWPVRRSSRRKLVLLSRRKERRTVGEKLRQYCKGGADVNAGCAVFLDRSSGLVV